MSRTLNQRMGDAHEADIAEWIGGSLQKASGSQWQAQGDAKNGEYLTPYPITGDGKATLGKSSSITRDMWMKIVDQTFGQIPALFHRFYRDETLRVSDIDLVTLAVRDFLPILQDARKWREQENNFAELVRLGQEMDTSGKNPMVKTGCDCCR